MTSNGSRLTDHRDHSAMQHTFNELGYLHLPAFFDAALMDRVDEICVAHFGDDPAWAHDEDFISRSQAETVPWFPLDAGTPEQVACFNDIDAAAHFAELTAAVIGAGWSRDSPMVMFSKPGTAGQPWHQDCAPDDAGMFNLNRLIYAAPILEATGGEVVVIPGSHVQGVLPIGPPTEDLAGQVTLRPGRGDLLLLHGHCWHRVMPVRHRHRYSVNYRATPAGTPADITDVCVYRNMRYRFSTREVIEERMPPDLAVGGFGQ